MISIELLSISHQHTIKLTWHLGKCNLLIAGERVPTINLNRILEYVLNNTDDVAWGPNAKFRCPNLRGTSSIWKSVASRLPEKRLHLNKEVSGVDLGKKQLLFKGGSKTKYDWLISTAPLNNISCYGEDKGSKFNNLRNEATTPWYSSRRHWSWFWWHWMIN